MLRGAAGRHAEHAPQPDCYHRQPCTIRHLVASSKACHAVQEPEQDSAFPSLDFTSIAIDVEDFDLMASDDQGFVANVVLRASGLEHTGRMLAQQVRATSSGFVKDISGLACALCNTILIHLCCIRRSGQRTLGTHS